MSSFPSYRSDVQHTKRERHQILGTVTDSGQEPLVGFRREKTRASLLKGWRLFNSHGPVLIQVDESIVRESVPRMHHVLQLPS
jgi:hypothetical protein